MKPGGLIRALLFAMLLTVGLAGPAVADANCDDTCANVEDGDNSGSADSAGSSASGDAVGGEVVGVVSAGDTSVDARNRSEKADLESGEAVGSNSAASFVGQNDSADAALLVSDATAGTATNVQDGDNSLELTQTADASSGDAVGGQVIGAVTSAGGSADIVADNASKKVDLETGDATADNASAAFVGQHKADPFGLTLIADATAATASNVQDGDNALDREQTAAASSGDSVGGQVIGAVSAGATSIGAKNRTEKVDVVTGAAQARNHGSAVVGQTDSELAMNLLADATAGTATNVQDGDNSADLTQTADATTGDGVAGQVIGAVTASGGSADVVAANASKKIDLSTGGATADNGSIDLVGQNESLFVVFLPIDATATTATNVQEGDNSLDAEQTATSTSGDGIGGQVIGAVSAGDTSIDARNASEAVDITTGNTAGSNARASFVGQDAAGHILLLPTGSTVSSSTTTLVFDATNTQEGDNESALDQTASAASGDGVGGQVLGAVASATGSADIVADNSSKKIDIETGDASATNLLGAFIGQNIAAITAIGPFEGSIDVTFGDFVADNLQDGDNSLAAGQSADASSGDGVGGQVLGVVSAGDASVDARNRSERDDVTTGAADATNRHGAFVGQNISGATMIGPTNGPVDVTTTSGPLEQSNVQEGDNGAATEQLAEASSGDGVAGQVAGVVTSAGGSADLVADNASRKVDLESGPSTFGNDEPLFVGLDASLVLLVGGP